MTRIIGALLCLVGRHGCNWSGWFTYTFGCATYIIDWERCGRCERVKMWATKDEHRQAEREGSR